VTGFATYLRANAAFLFAGALLAFASSFGQTFFISIFAGQIMETFSLSNGQWGLIYATGTAVSAAVMLWSGALTDRFRVRNLGLVVLLGLSAASLIMAINPWAWFLPVAIFLLRLTGQGMTSHIATVAMARWFVATRGRALSIAGAGFAMGEALLPLLFVWAMAFAGWRTLWLLVAGLVLLVVPVMHRLLRRERTPQSHAEADNTTGMENRHWTRGQMLRHPLFWCMFPAILGPAAFVTALFFQQVYLAEIKGWSHVALVALFPLYTGISTVFMLIAGWAIDRIGTARLMPFFQLPIAVGFLVMAQAESLGGAALAFALIGVTSGANATLPAAFWAEFYGTQNIGGIKAIATATMVLGSAIGPAITGLLIDAGVDFPAQMTGIAIWFVIASLLLSVGVMRARGSLSRAA